MNRIEVYGIKFDIITIYFLSKFGSYVKVYFNNFLINKGQLCLIIVALL